MNFKLGMALAAAVSVFAAASCAAQVPAYPPLNDGQSVSLPSTHYKFQDSGAKGATPNKGIQYSNVWGDVTKGAHGAFFRFDPGFTSYVHTHTYDYYAVVIKGELENYRPGETPAKLGPGSYWYQRGKEKHTTACVSKTPCEIYIVQSDKFDAQNLPNDK